jgi:tetratricopeptide (TPR) repeat protein
MLRRLTTIAALIAAVSIPFSVAAQDDGGMSFGEDEVEPAAEAEPDPNDPNAKIIAEGKALYEKKKYDEASLLFYKVLQTQDPAAEIYHAEAQYELGKTLYKMKLYQGALSHFGKIVDEGETHPFFIPTLRGLVVLTDEVPEDPLLMERLAAYKDFSSDVPEKYRDRFSYLVGRHLYSQLEVEAALEMLNHVTPASPDYPKARYIAGVTHVANYDAGPAVAAFKDVLRVLMAKKEEGKISEDEEKLLETTRLGMARVFYSTGEYPKSIKYYGQIPRKSEFWPIALFESSWAYFQVDQYNKALGNLHTLNSPFFSDQYFPEGPILSAVIFFYNCKYERVRAVLDEFLYQYEPILAEVNNVIASNAEDPEAMYEWLMAVREGAESIGLQQVAATALDDQQIKNKLRLIEAIEQEIQEIGDKPKAWKSSGLASTLVQDNELAISFAKSDAGTIATQRLERVSRELQDFVLEQEKILFEVTRAERGEIEADLRSEMQVDQDVTRKPKVNTSDEELYWTFEGEYWRDELGFYLFTVNSECKR